MITMMLMIEMPDMCCNIDAPNAGQTPDNRIDRCSDVTMVIDVLSIYHVDDLYARKTCDD